MPKINRHTGASVPAGPVEVVRESAGADVHIVGPGADLVVARNLVIRGDVLILGEIDTGTLADGATFGGIGREAVDWPPGRWASETAQINFDGLHRINMPHGIDTTIKNTFQVQEWWLGNPGARGTIGVYFEWSNDHTNTGTVSWEASIHAYRIGQDAVDGDGVVLATREWLEEAPAAEGPQTTSVIASVQSDNPCTFIDPGPLASTYEVRITRHGAEGTHGGPVGFVSGSMTRGQ